MAVSEKTPNGALRAARRQRRWRLRDAAEAVRAVEARLGGNPDAMGIDGDMVGKWERGEIEPSDFYKTRLCLAYGTADPGGLGWEQQPSLIADVQRHGIQLGLDMESLAAQPGRVSGGPGDIVTTIEHALATVIPSHGGPEQRAGLEGRVMDAWRAAVLTRTRPLLILIAGFAGSGKTEFGEFLSATTGWPLLDKDTLTRPMTEGLLAALGGDPNDRHTALYLASVRPHEYRALMAAAFRNLDCGSSTIVTAPFLAEVTDHAWLDRLRNQCAARRADLSVIWMDCDEGSMLEYLHRRGAARDAWKLSSWEDYLASIDPGTRPACDHFVVDNRLNAAIGLAEQARAIVERIRD